MVRLSPIMELRKVIKNQWTIKSIKKTTKEYNGIME